MSTFEDKDICTEWYRTQQWLGLNKIPTGCKVTHIQSGLSARCGSERSSVRNKAKAISELELLVADWIMDNVRNSRTPPWLSLQEEFKKNPSFFILSETKS